MQQRSFLKIRDMAFIAACSALLAVCAWISIPLAVPVTMQTFAVFLTAGLLGPKRATIAVAVYILLGAVGLPVFSNFRGGAGMLLGATGGYILGFILSAALSGFIISRCKDRILYMALAMAAGLLVCYGLGTIWYLAVYSKTHGPAGIVTVLSTCVLPFIIPDAVKIVLAALLVKRLKKYVVLK